MKILVSLLKEEVRKMKKTRVLAVIFLLFTALPITVFADDISPEGIREYLSDKEVVTYLLFESRYGEKADYMILDLVNYVYTYHNVAAFPNDSPTIEEFKANYKSRIDFYIDYMGATDFSDVRGELNKENFEQKILIEKKFNMYWFQHIKSHTWGNANDKAYNVLEQRQGVYQGKIYDYYFVYPAIKEQSKYWFDNRYEKGFGWFSDIARYAETGDETYLFQDNLFSDIVDNEQIAEDGHIMDMEEFRQFMRDKNKKADERREYETKQNDARKNNSYVSVYINYIGEGNRSKTRESKWYLDDTLNEEWRGDLKSFMYGEGEYEKFVQEVSTVPAGGSIRFREDKVQDPNVTYPWLIRTLTRID